MRREKKPYGARFDSNSNGFPLSSHIKVLGWLDGSLGVIFTLSALSLNIRHLCGKHTSASRSAPVLTQNCREGSLREAVHCLVWLLRLNAPTSQLFKGHWKQRLSYMNRRKIACCVCECPFCLVKSQ